MKKISCKGSLYSYLGHFSNQKFLDQGHNDSGKADLEDKERLERLDAKIHATGKGVPEVESLPDRERLKLVGEIRDETIKRMKTYSSPEKFDVLMAEEGEEYLRKNLPIRKKKR